MFHTKAELKERVKYIKEIGFKNTYNFWRHPIKATNQRLENKRLKKEFSQGLQEHYRALDVKEKALREEFIPREIEVKPSHLKIGAEYTQTFFLGSLPDFVSAGQFIDILNLPIPFTLSYTFEGTRKSKLIKSCNSMIAGLNGRLDFERNNGKIVNTEVEGEIKEIMNFIRDLDDGLEEAFYISIYVNIHADTEAKLTEYSKKFVDEVSDMDFNFHNSYLNQKTALLQSLPIAREDKENKHLVSTRAMANLSPLLASDIHEPEGIFIGENLVNGSKIILDLFKGSNSNMNIFGKAGSGKSFLSKLLISRLLLRGVQNVIIDPEGEYTALAREYGGEVITFDREKGINPFFIYTQDSEDIEAIQRQSQDQIIKLKEFFSFFIHESNKQPGLLGGLLKQYFAETKPKNRAMLTFIDFLEEKNKIKPIPFLEDLLELQAGSSFGGFFNSTDTYDLSSELIVFEFHQIQEESIKIPVMYLLTKLVSSLANNKDRKTMIIVDEAHLLLKHKMTGEFLQILSKTVRKRNTGLVCISQETEDFRIENGGKTIMTQAEVNFILKQSGASLNYIDTNNILPLTKEEQRDITDFNNHEGYIIRQSEHIVFKAQAFPEEEAFIRTDFNQ